MDGETWEGGSEGWRERLGKGAVRDGGRDLGRKTVGDGGRDLGGVRDSGRDLGRE